MPLTLRWQDVALRLILTFVAGALIGYNRGEHGRPAGLRTTILVCLAASVSMIQANLLLATSGKQSDSFVVLDLMRLPLGVLSGMGFIGGGAILKKGDLVLGVTTAATLWFVTAMGLCFGGGQIELGLALLIIGLIVLWGMKKVEKHLRQEHRATLNVILEATGPREDELRSQIRKAGLHVTSWGMVYANEVNRREVICNIKWKSCPNDFSQPKLAKNIADTPGVLNVRWSPLETISAGLD